MIDSAAIDSAITDTVIFADGSRGLLLSSPLTTDPDAMAEVLLDSGQRLFLPISALVPSEKGHHVAVHPSQFQEQTDDTDMTVIPVIEEVLTAGKREVETGRVRLRKTVSERTETVDEPLIRTEAQVRRVAVNQFVDSPPPVRHEDGVMIIPIFEEVLIVEKRIRLVEEVYVSQTRTEHREPQSVTLRTETITEERLPGEISPSD